MTTTKLELKPRNKQKQSTTLTGNWKQTMGHHRFPDGTIFAERNAAVLKIASTLEEYCSQTSKATDPGSFPFRRSLLNL